MPVSVHVIGVAGDGEAVAERLAAAGHTVSGPAPTAASDVAAAVGSAPGADVVVIVGGVGPRGLVPAALAPALRHELPGFGELLRQLAFQARGAEAIGLRALAGVAERCVVFAIPDDAALAELALDRLILPDLDRWGAPAVSQAAPTPIPFGGAGRTAIGLSTGEVGAPTPASPAAAESDDGLPPPGWKRAVHALKGELTIGRAPDLPEPIESLAPVVNVLHTAGESGTLKLPSGRRYAVFGWPDLRRDNAKVLAVGWGEPLAEVVALHRHPREAGTCVPGGSGLLARADQDLAELCKRVTGRPPPDLEGSAFAVQEGEVWILRGRRVVNWDGSREKDDGNPKQVLSSLTLHWSNR